MKRKKGDEAEFFGQTGNNFHRISSITSDRNHF